METLNKGFAKLIGKQLDCLVVDMLIEYPKYCEECNNSFDEFKYRRDFYIGGCIQLIRLCPICEAEIECKFISEEENQLRGFREQEDV